MKIKYQHRDPQFHLFISTNNTYPLHLHKNVEIAMVLSGNIHVHIDQKEYVLSEGDMAIIFPNQPHDYRTADHSRILLIFFDASFPGDYTGDLLHHVPDYPVIPRHPVVSGTVTSLYKLYHEPGDSRLLKAYISVLLGHVLPLLSLKKVDYTKDMDLFQKILAYIDLHFLEPINLEALSRDLGISKFLISRIFSEQFHVSFRDYINGQRAAYAHMLLLSTADPVTEIAFDSGFNSLRSFYRVFKKEYGMTPNEFRRSLPEGMPKNESAQRVEHVGD
ncbi:AraC family transcriptional regulator [Paenibacillus sp. XY044]|uniref:AraC family transcriptional regulator n=1 Tax=Paenibacillus sp. XY044 TaxID=2026089 RepID=UPI0015C5F3EB|nr:AraC family transcriptional regulator [Paenibacillus sp. XY044]